MSHKIDLNFIFIGLYNYQSFFVLKFYLTEIILNEVNLSCY